MNRFNAQVERTGELTFTGSITLKIDNHEFDYHLEFELDTLEIKKGDYAVGTKDEVWTTIHNMRVLDLPLDATDCSSQDEADAYNKLIPLDWNLAVNAETQPEDIHGELELAISELNDACSKLIVKNIRRKAYPFEF